MISFNSDGSIKLPSHLVKKQVDQKQSRTRYEELFEKAKYKRIRILFLVDEPIMAENVYAGKMEDNPISKLFQILNISTDDMGKALEALLNKGYFIVYSGKKDSEMILRTTLSDLHPDKIVAIGPQFDRKLGFIREDSRFVNEKIELNSELAQKIEAILKEP